MISSAFVPTAGPLNRTVRFITRTPFRTGGAIGAFVSVPARTLLGTAGCVFLGALGAGWAVASIGPVSVRTSTIRCGSFHCGPLHSRTTFRAAAWRGQARAEAIVTSLVDQRFVVESGFRLPRCGFVDGAFPRWTATASAASASRTARTIGIGGPFFSRVLFSGDEVVEILLHRWQAVAIRIPVARDIPRGFPAIPIRDGLASRFLLGQPIKQVVREASLIPFEDRRWFRRPLFTGGSITPLSTTARIVASTRTILTSRSGFRGRSHVFARATVPGGGSLLAARAISAGPIVSGPIFAWTVLSCGASRFGCSAGGSRFAAWFDRCRLTARSLLAVRSPAIAAATAI